MRQRLPVFLLTSLALLGTVHAQTVEGIGSTTATVAVTAEVGPACQMTTSTDRVTLTPTLYWTNTSDATGGMSVNVKCNMGTAYALRVPATLALQNGQNSINATLTGAVDNVVASDSTSNTAATASGQNHPVAITVAHGEVTQNQPTGTYEGTAVITLEVLAPAPELPPL